MKKIMAVIVLFFVPCMSRASQQYELHEHKQKEMFQKYAQSYVEKLYVKHHENYQNIFLQIFQDLYKQVYEGAPLFPPYLQAYIRTKAYDDLVDFFVNIELVRRKILNAGVTGDGLQKPHDISAIVDYVHDLLSLQRGDVGKVFRLLFEKAQKEIGPDPVHYYEYLEACKKGFRYLAYVMYRVRHEAEIQQQRMRNERKMARRRSRYISRKRFNPILPTIIEEDEEKEE